MYANNDLYFVGNLVTKIYFYHQEVLVYVLSKGVVYPAYRL